MKAGKGCDPLPGLTCSGGRLVGGFTFFRSLAFSLPCALRSIGGSAFAKAIGGRFAVPAAVRRGHCRFAAARKFLPRAATGPRDVVAIFVVGKEGDIHRAAHARIVETALIEALAARPDRLFEPRPDLAPTAGGGQRHDLELGSGRLEIGRASCRERVCQYV